MENDTCKPKSYVMGPDGAALALNNLPLPGTIRWVSRRKAEIVAGVRGGLLSLAEAYERYELTPDEFLAWQDALDLFGIRGLRAANRRDTRATDGQQSSGAACAMPSPLKTSEALETKCDIGDDADVSAARIMSPSLFASWAAP